MIKLGSGFPNQRKMERKKKKNSGELKVYVEVSLEFEVDTQP